MKKRNIIIGFLMLGSLFTFTSCVSKKPANTGSKPTQTEPTTPSPTTPSPTTPSPTTPSPTTPSPTTPGTSTPEPTVPSEPTTNPEPVEEKYTVNFVTNCEITIEAQKIEDGEKIQTIPNLTKTGYKFAGWYLDEEFTLSFDITNDVVTSEITLYAKWEKEEYTIVFNTLGGNTINSVKVKYQDTLTQPANPTKLGYIFDGWYTDNACTNVYDFDAQVTSGFTLYAKWREKSKYDELLEKADALVLNNDFNSYGATDTLATYSGTWGTKGIYQYINEKLGVGTADPTANKVILGAGNAELYDNSGNGTQLVLDFGGLSGGIVEGYLETTLIDQGNSWTFFQLYGKEGAEVVEVFGIRIESGVLKYRLDGAVANPLNTITAANTTYKIYYKVNLDTKELTMTINEIEFASVTISKSELVGLKLVSSDNNNRRMKVDNVVVINENYSLPELKNILKARLATLKDDYVASYPTADLSSALTNGQAAIDAAETVASAYQAYDNAKAAMDVIVLSIYKEQKKAELDTYVDSSKYTENATALAKAIEDGKAAIDAAITTEAISNAVIAAKTAIDAIESDEVILAKAKETAVAELEAYKAGQFTVNEAAYQVALTNGENVINAATTKAAVASALASAKEAIDAIKTDAEETAAKRAAAIEEITTYATTKKNEINDTDEATTYQAKIDNEVTLGTASINAAEYAAIDNAVVIIKQKIDNLVSAAKETLAEYKVSSKEQIEAYAASAIAKYNNATLTESITTAKNNAFTAIDSKTTKDEVNTVVNNVIAEIDDLVEAYEITLIGSIDVTEYAGHLESAYLEWTPEETATSYNVYYKASGANDSTYVKIDDMLIREYPTYYRADVLGLKAGNYDLKVVAVKDNTEIGSPTIKSVEVAAHDRSGYAHFGNTTGVGAYNDDGTLKSNAQVLYLYQGNIDTCKLTINGTEYTGIKDITQAIKIKNNCSPVAIRIIGKVDGGSSGSNLSCSDMSSAYALGVKEADQVTIEGVGEDATLYNCGVAAFSSSNIEVRNLGLMNWGGGSDGDGISIKKTEHVWVHNIDFFYGNAGSDGDQAKGDGSMDLKDNTKYMTISYCHFWDSGKMSLCGMKSESGENWITYHHNWFDHSDSRHPRVRTMTVHVYNNYYDGNAKYGMATAYGANIFSEGNYFRNCPKPYLIGGQGTENGEVLGGEKGSVIKAYNDYFEDPANSTYIPYTSTCGTNFDVYVASTRDEVVASTVTTIGGYSYNNFDTDSSKIYSYTADDPQTAKTKVEKYSGRMNGGDFLWTFDNSVDDESYALNTPLKTALNNYKSSLVSIQGIGGSGSGSGSGGTTDPIETLTAEDVIALINALPDKTNVTSSNRTAILEAKEKYDSLSVEEQAKVTNYTKLTEVLEALNSLPQDTQILTFDTGASGDNSFFTVSGNLQSKPTNITYNGVTYSTALKLESATSIKFTITQSSTITFVTDGASKKIKINGTNYTTDANGILVVTDLSVGEITITKGDSMNLYAIIVE
ncbi:MAG: InlB B-repeat-containing protein [Anaeroplasma sp.]